MMLSRTFKFLLPMVLAASCAFADGPKASDFKLKVTGVAVADDTGKNYKLVGKVASPETRVVVKSEKQLAMFFIDYDLPDNVSARIWLEPNCTHSGAGGRFGSSPSGLHSGKGKTERILHLGDDCHGKHVHLKSVRLSVTLEDDKGEDRGSFYIGDVPVNVVYAHGEMKEGDEFDVLEPLSPPPAVTTTLLPGWTEDFEAAKAKAKQEGKLVLAYFLNSRKRAKGEPGILDGDVLGSKEFVERAGKSFVLYMCELDETKQSWAAKDNAMVALKYASRRGSFRPPEVAIVDPDGKRVALLEKKDREGGVDGFLAKIEEARKTGMEKVEAERKARAEAMKKLPAKTDGTSTPAGFTDNLGEALAKAKQEGKLVYACFSGSDWCGWCKRLEEEVLSDPLFVAGAMDDYVLVFIDSPSDKNLLSDHAKAENDKLVKKYEIKGFPTALILDGDGKKVGKTGYRDGGAAKYVEHLKELKKSAPFAEKADPAPFSAVSPDGLNEVRLEVGDKGMSYSVWRRGKALVEPTAISLVTSEHGRMNGENADPNTTTRKVEGKVATPIYKKSEVDLAANETRVDFGDWAVVLHARNDGVAWRFETKYDGEATVTAENTNVRFPKGAMLCYGQVGGFATSFERPATIGPVESVKSGHPQIVITPLTASVPGAGVVCITESNLLDYPGLNFYRRDGETDMLRSWQAGVPSETERKGRWIRVKNRHSYLAKTSGTRVYPWRVFVLGDTPSDLVSSDAVYALAEPCRLADTSWVKPGLVQWDWWHGFKITDVPGLKSGCNYETYRAYIDYASASGIPYIIMDEGWSERLNLDKPRDAVNVEGVINYGKEKGVGVILWAAWAMLYDPANRARVFDRYAAMGAKGFKIDFMDRDDQDIERFLENTASDAAKRKLVVMYHGVHKPTGLCRTFPNVLNYEGVYGLEQGHSRGGQKVVVANDVNLPYTRMVAGAMDYTPGAMRNRAFSAPEFQRGKDVPSCYGTRCHQLALFPIFEAPVQMLCDSPTQYRSEPECAAFIAQVPTVWDETVGVAGEIGAFSSVARRKGRDWWLGAITNWEKRELELPTKFLGEGEWKVEAFEDAADADVNAEHYVRREFTVKAGDPIKVCLAPGGGFAARFTPASKASASICEGVESMKVMTYNIRYSAGDRNSADNNWEARRDDLANLVESANPDVAGFQEVLPDQRKWLETRFPGYAFVGDGRNADRVNGEASPIVFRKDRFDAVKSGTFWLSETPDEPGSKSWKAALPRICSYAVLKDKATGKTFAFANAHTDHASEEAREKGMLLVIERMKEFSSDAPVLFVGDHNCLEYEKPAQAVAKLLKDALYLSETPPEGSWRTFNYWSYKEKEQTIAEALAKPVRERSIPGGKSDSKRIDYIYVSPGTRVLGYRTIAATRPGTKLYPSDHFPSVAEVVIGATPATPYVVEAPGSAKLVFDTSNAPDLRKWTEEKFAPAMCEWVVKLTDIMASDGWEPPKDILFKFVVEPLQWDTNAPAWASSTEGRVSLRVDWFRANLNGEALGATIHELTHIMQAYWSEGQNKDNCPDWAVEGYADYIRWVLFEPEADGCGYVRNDIKKYHYNDSYRVTAHFFCFVESRYPGTMKTLNAALRDHTFDNGKFWKDATGKTVEDLEASWKAAIWYNIRQ